MSNSQLLLVIAIALGFLVCVFAISLRLFRSHSADAFKNAVEIVKVVALVLIASMTYLLVDRHRQDLSAADHDLKVYQTFFQVSSSSDAHARLRTLRNIDAYRQNFLAAGSPLDDALVALSKSILEDPTIQTLLAAPENVMLVESIANDRSSIIRNGITTLEDVLGPMAGLSAEQVEVWGQQNLTLVELPFSIPLAWEPSVRITRIRVHKMAVPFFQAVFSDIVDQGLQSTITEFGGVYTRRGRPGAHSYGVAIDLNPETNRLGTTGDIDPRLVSVFKANGFLWGGDFSRPDPMHFELDPRVFSRRGKAG